MGAGAAWDIETLVPRQCIALAVTPCKHVCCAVQVGIEECLHIEFEYDKARYHLKVSRGARGWLAAGQHKPDPQLC